MSSRPASARRPGDSTAAQSRSGSARGGRKGHTPSVAAFLSFLQSHGASHFSSALMENGYNLENLEGLTERDLRQMRITNHRDQEKMIGVASVAREIMRASRHKAASRREASREAAAESEAAAPSSSSAPLPAAAAGHESPQVSPPGDPDEETPRRTRVSIGREGSYTAALPTSNERIRQATLYVDHHAVDRNWPCAGSSLARSLSLSNATPHTGSHTLYVIHGAREREAPPPPYSPSRSRAPGDSGPSVTGRRPKSSSGRRNWNATAINTARWKPTYNASHRKDAFGDAPPVPTRTATRATSPPIETDPVGFTEAMASPPTAVPRCSEHGHGRSAAFCGVCEQTVKDSAIEGQGQWQYQVKRTVMTGPDAEDTVFVWEPFDPMDCMVLEHALRQRKPRIRVGRNHADFRSMLWGPHKMRRVQSSAVPFPTLKKSDLVHPPELDAAEENALLEDLDESFRRLIITEEERARFHLYHQQSMSLDIVLAEIADMMAQMFEGQRADLEAEETLARQKVFDENFECALDDMWAEAEKSVMNVQLTDVRRSSENILLKQQDILSKLESIERDKIILAERAARENFVKLIGRFNSQVKALLKKRANPDEANTTLRCRWCRKMNCTFFHSPWQGHWRHQGPEYRPDELPQCETKPILRPPSAPARRARKWAKVKKARKTVGPHGEALSESDSDDHVDRRDQVADRRPLRPRVDPPLAAPFIHPRGYRNVAELIGAAKEVEYQEYLADKRRRKFDTHGTERHTLETAPSSPRIAASTHDAGPSFENEGAAALRVPHAPTNGVHTPHPPSAAAHDGEASAAAAAVRRQLERARQRPGSASPRRPPFKP